MATDYSCEFEPPYYRAIRVADSIGDKFGILNAIVKRTIGPNESILISDGEVFTCPYIENPTFEQVTENPRLILFMNKPTIEMWTTALKQFPYFLRFSPLNYENKEFIREIQKHVPITDELLENLHPNTTEEDILAITENAGVSFKMLAEFINSYHFEPTVDAFIMSIEANGKDTGFADFAKFHEIYGHFGAPKDTFRIASACFKAFKDMHRGDTLQILMYVIGSLDKHIPEDSDLLAHMVSYVAKWGDYIMMDKICENLSNNDRMKFIELAAKTEKINLEYLSLRHVDFNAYKKIKLHTDDDKIAAIRIICEGANKD